MPQLFCCFIPGPQLHAKRCLPPVAPKDNPPNMRVGPGPKSCFSVQVQASAIPAKNSSMAARLAWIPGRVHGEVTVLVILGLGNG